MNIQYHLIYKHTGLVSDRKTIIYILVGICTNHTACNKLHGRCLYRLGMDKMSEEKELLKQAAKALLVFNDMCPKCWDAKEHYALKQVVHNALDEIKEIMSPELLELVRQERE